jgi:multidrug resistance efflux pump
MASEIAESASQDSTAEPSQAGAGRSKLVQRLLASSGNLPQFLNDLLTTMAVVVAGTEAAGFVVERGGEGGQDLILRPVAHLRPDDSSQELRDAAIKAFQEIIAPCVQQGKDGAIEVGAPDAGEPQYCLVTLLRSDAVIVAATAVITRARDVERARQRLTSMQLVAGYFELFQLRRGAIEARTVAQSHQNVLQLATAVSNAEGFEAAAMNLCNELANRTGATRVSLGWLKGRSIKLRALSHTEKFDKKQELIVQIQRAMEECFDQEEPVKFEADGQRSENVTRAAEALSRAQGGNSVLSLPLRKKDDVEGVLTLEFAPPAKLPEPVVEALMVAADILTPQLRDRYDNDRWLAVKAGHSIQRTAGMAIGPKHMLPKLIIALVIGAGFFVTFFRPMYHVSAPFKLEAIGKQQVSIPFEGKIVEIRINPRTGKQFQVGDEITKGDVLATMDTQETSLKMYGARSRAAAARARANAARDASETDPSKVAEMLEAAEEEKSYTLEADTYKLQIDDADIKADFDGVIIRADDLDTKRNLAVKRGDVLMEIAKRGQLRAEMAVSEKDIQEVRDGNVQHGKLATSSFPGEEFGFTVDRIVPMGDAKEGDNVFKVYGQLDKEPAIWMRPGMAGEARIDVGKRRLVWIWTHRLIDFLKLKLWM